MSPRCCLGMAAQLWTTLLRASCRRLHPLGHTPRCVRLYWSTYARQMRFAGLNFFSLPLAGSRSQAEVPCWQWLITQYLIKPDPITYYAEWNKQTEGDCQRSDWWCGQAGFCGFWCPDACYKQAKPHWTKRLSLPPPCNPHPLQVNFQWKRKWGGGGYSSYWNLMRFCLS